MKMKQIRRRNSSVSARLQQMLIAFPTPAVMGLVAVLVLGLPLSGGPRVCCEGDHWLTLPRVARETYVSGLMQGFATGFPLGCVAAVKKLQRTAEGKKVDPSRLFSDCTAAQVSPPASSDFYVDLITG